MKRKLLYGELFLFKFKLPKKLCVHVYKKIANVAHYVIFLLLVERSRILLCLKK